MPILALDGGPSGAAVLLSANGSRLLGAWGWSWSPTGKGGQALLHGGGERRDFRDLAAIGEHIAARAARTSPQGYRLVSETLWDGGNDKGGGDVGRALSEHPACAEASHIGSRVWIRELLDLTEEEARREPRVHCALEARLAERGTPRLPPPLRDHRHAWDALGLGLWATGQS